MSPTQKNLGPVGGVRAFFAGLGFVIGRPKVWPYAAVPAIAALALATALASLGIWGATGALRSWFGPLEGTLEAVGYYAAHLLVDAAIVLAALFLGTLLAQPIASPALDAIVRAVEIARGRPAAADPPFVESVRRSIKITLVTLAIGTPVLGALTAVEFLFPPVAVVTWPLKFVATALLAAWNLLDYPFGLRRMGIRARYAFYRAHLGACLGFGALVALTGLVPLVGLLILPAGVAGAARLVLDAEALAGTDGHRG